MLNAEIYVRSIDYERTFQALFPLLMETVNRMDSENLTVRLLQKLGESSKDIVTGILRRLLQPHQDEILCQMLRHYRAEVCKQLNTLLAVNGFENCIVIKQLDAQKSDSGIWLKLNRVVVDYAEMLKNEQVQQAIGNAAKDSSVGQMIQSLSGNSDEQWAKRVSGVVSFLSKKKTTDVTLTIFRKSIEKQTLHFLEKVYLPGELGKIVSDYLKSKGIYAEVSTLKIQQSAESLPEPEEERFLSKELEFAIVDAVADTLRDR